ncbi:Zinc finger HIT domain-containing protein 2 [Coemansia sp. RSA 2711]|nr:Zinc finger HIT domain-containing protein 2 [Coemansia sp. RSA 2711]
MLPRQESFYKDQAEEAVKAQKTDEATKEEMQRIVRRYQDQIEQDGLEAAGLAVEGDSGSKYDDSDSEENEETEEVDLAERLAGIDLSNDADQSTLSDVWNRLTKSERDEFIKLINDQNLGAIITPWNPWWLAPGRSGILEIDDGSNAAGPATKDQQSRVPPVLDIGAPVSSLASKVHPSVLLQLAQVSLAYIYMMRHLNGEPRGENLVAAFIDLATASPLLASRVADVYTSTHEALTVGFCNIDELMSSETKCTLLDDMLAIYADPLYVAAMVSDMYGIVGDLLAAGSLAKSWPKRSQIKHAERRLYFIASIVKQMRQEPDPWQFMAADIALLKRRHGSEAQALQRDPPLAALRPETCRSSNDPLIVRPHAPEN